MKWIKFDQNESIREGEIRDADNRKRTLIQITVKDETSLFPLPENVGERKRERERKRELFASRNF